LDVDTIFGDLGVNVYIRNTIFRKASPSVVSGYGKRSINLNKVVANFEKHISHPNRFNKDWDHQ
jgi:hypothetical protein